MTDHFTARDLIQRLTDELEFWSDLACTPSELPFEQDDMLKLITEARAYLAQPEPEGPTDEELLHVAASAINPYESGGIAIGEYEAETECAVEVYGSELIAFARAALARWGRPS